MHRLHRSAAYVLQPSAKANPYFANALLMSAELQEYCLQSATILAPSAAVTTSTSNTHKRPGKPPGSLSSGRTSSL